MKPESVSPLEGTGKPKGDESNKSTCLPYFYYFVNVLRVSWLCWREEFQQRKEARGSEVPHPDKVNKGRKYKDGDSRARNEDRLLKPDKLSSGFSNPSLAAAPKLQPQGNSQLWQSWGKLPHVVPGSLCTAASCGNTELHSLQDRTIASRFK